MTGQIAEATAALAIELIGERKYDLGSRGHCTLPCDVNVRPLRFHDRSDSAPLWCIFVVAEGHDCVADADFRMDQVSIRVGIPFAVLHGVERVLVELDSGSGVSDKESWHDGLDGMGI